MAITNFRSRTGQLSQELRPRVRPKRPKAATASLAPKASKRPKPRDPYAEQIKAALELQFAGADRALAGEQAVNQQMARSIPQWYADYQAQLNAATMNARGAYQNAGAQQQQTAQSLAGLGVDPAAAQSQQAAAARAASAGQFADLTARQGAADVAYSGRREVVGAGQRLQALEGEANRGRALARDAMDLAAQKGAFATKTRADLVNAARQRQLENAAFGLDQQKAATDAAAKAETAAERRRARITRGRQSAASRDLSAARLTEAQRHNRALEAQAQARASGTSPAETRKRKAANRDVWAKIRTGLADAKRAQHAQVYVTGPDGKVETKDGKPTGRKTKVSPEDVRDNLRNHYKDADIADAAWDLAYRGTISAPVAARLRQRGIALPSEWLPARLNPRITTARPR